ncbi:MAG: hypothetical protein FWD92_06430 [Methanomassiliicoccaceae archaeon]|nr:hypothetical protein [Methanomassiliicoccaceae archaeon]
MTLNLNLKITYSTAAEAEAVFKALEPDNTGYIDSEIRGNELTFRIGSDNAGTLRNAVDDLLACVKIVEEALNLSDAVPDLDGDALLE